MAAMTRHAALLSIFLLGCGQGSTSATESANENDAATDAPDDTPDTKPATCGNGAVDGAELCDGPPVACNSLSPVWSAGTAACRADCSGYDVTSCTLGAQRVDTIYPANHDPRWANARCNDQTPFAFQVSMAPVRTDKWVVYFEGGGACDGIYTSCKGRPAALTSTKAYESEHSSNWATKIGVVLSRDPAVNPDFHDANFVFGQYCSSDGWSGTNTTPQPITTKTGTAQWVFTGRNNARALAQLLFRDFGLDDHESRILVTGNSAGGIGAFLNVDLFATRMPTAIAERRIALLPSAAWSNTEFSDPNFPYAGSKEPFATISAKVEAVYGFDADPKCLALAAAAGAPKSACAGSVFNHRASASPAPVGWGIRTLVAKNREDAATMNDYRLPPTDTTDPAAIKARADWLAQMNDELKDVAWLYAPDDPMKSATDDNLHGMISDPLVWTFDPPGFPGLSLQKLVSRFWADGMPARVVFAGDVPHTDSPM